jgi:hypothetical protein
MFKVEKGCRTGLERQGRIQQRWSVLNKRGEFNQCKLTRMDVIVMWEQKRGDLERDEEPDLTSRAKEKRRRVEEGAGMKRRNREEITSVWGESMFKGPGEESILTEPEGSKRRDCSDGWLAGILKFSSFKYHKWIG